MFEKGGIPRNLMMKAHLEVMGGALIHGDVHMVHGELLQHLLASVEAVLRASIVVFIFGQDVHSTGEEGTRILCYCEGVIVPGFFCDIECFRDHFSDPTWQF